MCGAGPVGSLINNCHVTQTSGSNTNLYLNNSKHVMGTRHCTWKVTVADHLCMEVQGTILSILASMLYKIMSFPHFPPISSPTHPISSQTCLKPPWTHLSSPDRVGHHAQPDFFSNLLAVSQVMSTLYVSEHGCPSFCKSQYPSFQMAWEWPR